MKIEQTAIQYLYERAVKKELNFFDLAEAMKMHKEEVLQAYDEGWGDGRTLRLRDGKEYYNETYGNDPE